MNLDSDQKEYNEIMEICEKWWRIGKDSSVQDFCNKHFGLLAHNINKMDKDKSREILVWMSVNIVRLCVENDMWFTPHSEQKDPENVLLRIMNEIMKENYHRVIQRKKDLTCRDERTMYNFEDAARLLKDSGSPSCYTELPRK